MNYKVNSKQRGFTLIELVVVILILGILAATAVPKFIDLSTNAKDAVVKGGIAAMQSAIALTYAQTAASGGSTPIHFASFYPGNVSLDSNISVSGTSCSSAITVGYNGSNSASFTPDATLCTN